MASLYSLLSGSIYDQRHLEKETKNRNYWIKTQDAGRKEEKREKR
jgi:hypothetical protein